MRTLPSTWALRALLLSVCLAPTACRHLVGGPDLVSVGERSTALLIRDVSVFDGVGPALHEHRDVLVRDGVVDLVRAAGEVVAPEGAVIVDGAGRTLLPGLIDAHGHVTLTGAPPWVIELPSAEQNLAAHLYAGVTTVLDLGGMPREIEAARAGPLAHVDQAPRVFFAGPLVTAESGYPGAYVERLYPWPLDDILVAQLTRSAPTVSAAREVAVELDDGPYDLLKVVLASTPIGAPVLATPVVVTLAEQAHRRRKAVFAHVEDTEHALMAARAGVDVLAHGVHTSALSDEEAAELARWEVAVTPTLLSLERLHQLVTREVVFTAMETATEDPDLLASFSPERIDGYDVDKSLEEWLLHVEAHREDARANLKKLVAAGVPILVGTDANGSPGCFPAGIHEEMRLLVEGGVPSLEVLRGATSRPAALVPGPPGLGWVVEGGPADLLLVEGDPLVDITATERIVLVLRDGREVQRRPPSGKLPR